MFKEKISLLKKIYKYNLFQINLYYVVYIHKNMSGISNHEIINFLSKEENEDIQKKLLVYFLQISSLVLSAFILL